MALLALLERMVVLCFLTSALMHAAQMPVYTIQRDPANFEDPDAFIPERWVEGTPESAANKRLPGSWISFGEGTRVCVGQRFALQEAKITLARMFQQYVACIVCLS